MKHIRAVGSPAWRKVPGNRKLKDRANECILLGYEGDVIYRLWDKVDRRMIRSNDVHIQEIEGKYVDPRPQTGAPVGEANKDQPANGHSIREDTPQTEPPTIDLTEDESQIDPQEPPAKAVGAGPEETRGDRPDEAVGADDQPRADDQPTAREQHNQSIGQLTDLLKGHPQLDFPMGHGGKRPICTRSSILLSHNPTSSNHPYRGSQERIRTGSTKNTQ